MLEFYSEYDLPAYSGFGVSSITGILRAMSKEINPKHDLDIGVFFCEILFSWIN